MKKSFYLFILLTISTFSLGASSLPYKLDFTTGFPDDVILIDEDQLAPSLDVMKFGFKKGVPWVIRIVDDDHRQVACSTSWYQSPGTSSDWLILPPLHIDSDDMELRWEASASDDMYADGYSVYISENTETPDEFRLNSPVFNINAEEARWTPHSISLSPYKDKDIRVAFVNNSNNCAMLYIDNIFIGTPQSFEVTSILPGFLLPGENINLNASVTALASPVNEVAIEVKIDDLIIDHTFSDLDISIGESKKIHFPTEISFNECGRHDFEATITINSQSIIQKGVLQVVSRKSVVEEGTGTWCGFCVRGIVALEELQKTHPEEAISIAVHNSDIMAVPDYDINSIVAGAGLPVITVNRKNKLSESFLNLPEVIDEANSSPIIAAVTADYSLNEDNTFLNVTSHVAFNSSYNNSRFLIGYFIKENNVVSPDLSNPAYNQKNYYANNAYGPMGGYENKPEVIPASEMIYQHVARFCDTDVKGVPESLPSSIIANEHYTHQRQIPIPQNILKLDECELVVMVIDQLSKEIVNAFSTPIVPNNNGIHQPYSLENETLSLIIKSVEHGILTVTSSAKITRIDAYSPAGHRIAHSVPDDNTSSLDLKGYKGVVILHAITPHSSITSKVRL